MRIIGIAGTNGSGKDTVGQMLAERHGYLFVSVTDILRAELSRRGLPLDRQHMRELSAEWRAEVGLAVLVDKAVEICEAQSRPPQGLAVASLRNPGEPKRIHELGGRVVWVDGDPKVRYERIQANLKTRGEHRAVDDQKTFEQFLADEEAEMNYSGDETTLSGSAVKAEADILIINNGQDVETFKDSAEKALGLTE